MTQMTMRVYPSQETKWRTLAVVAITPNALNVS